MSLSLMTDDRRTALLAAVKQLEERVQSRRLIEKKMLELMQDIRRDLVSMVEQLSDQVKAEEAIRRARPSLDHFANVFPK